MYRDVGMAVPKTTATSVETGHTNTAQITSSLHLFFVRHIFLYAVRLLGDNIVHEKKM